MIKNIDLFNRFQFANSISLQNPERAMKMY